MRLSRLASGFTLKAPVGDPDITLITEHSRKVRPGALFVAVRGTTADGHDYVREALDRGAAAIAVERAVPPGTRVAHVIVPDGARALALLASRFHGDPAASLDMIGFTGTFGKTTTSDILRALLDAAGRRPAVIGSLGVRFDGFHDPGDGLTTPSAPQLHEWLSEVKERGAGSVIMEVTSHALSLGRVEGITFSGGLLAAIMPGEHTDFHRTYEDYVAAKRLFLNHLDPAAVLAYDADNRAASQLAREARVRQAAGFTLGPRRDGLLALERVSLDEHGATFTVQDKVARSSLLGRPNARNAALALAYALASGIPADAALPVLASLQPLPRRMQRLTAAGRTILDDTSGHADSLIALFEVVGLMPREQLVVAWAIRGSRGADVNRANAFALSDLSAIHGADALFITAAADETEPKDRVMPEEVDAVRAALHLRGRHHEFHETLAGAMRAVAGRSRAGDLVVLAGAQGMNAGQRLLAAELV